MDPKKLAKQYEKAADELERSHPASSTFASTIAVLRKEAEYWRNVSKVQ